MIDVHKSPLKVLMIGKGDAYHLEPLAQCIKIASPNIWLEVHGLRETKADGTKDYPSTSTVFDVVHQFPWSTSELRPKYKSAQKKPLERSHDSQPTWMKCARMFFRSVWSKKSRKHMRYFKSLLGEFDLIHLQSIFYTPALRWLLLSPNTPIVVSCWGSDFLRQSDIFRTLNQQQLLRLASAITVTGNESREVVLAKYGRELLPKMHNTFFNPRVEGFVDSNRDETFNRFRTRWGIPLDRLAVCIGHNGFSEGQHLDLIKSVAAIEEKKKDSLFVIVPMTYGASSEYQDLITKTLHEVGLSGIVLKEFLTEEELKDLRLATDILIYAPVSDAFSASVSQALAAGNVAILGSWLPYKTRQRAGFKYWEIDAPFEAGQMMDHILDKWPEAQLQTKPNRQLSAKFFSQEKIGKQWINVYKNAIQYFKENSKK